MNDESQRLEQAIDQLPGALQETAANAWQRIAGQYAGMAADDLPAWPEDAAAVFARLLACSDYAASVCVRHWPWVNRSIASRRFDAPPTGDFQIADALNDDAQVKKRLREYRHRQLLHILWRDHAGTASVEETLSSLSALADELLIAARDAAAATLSAKHGLPVADGSEVSLVILAMGKLGGGELNFSSDIDLIFLYTGDGETNGERRLSAHEYFTRIVRRIFKLLDDVTEDGFVYRVDTRLRPFGDSGPPVVSFSSLESYLLRHGRAWERYAYVKARPVGEHPQGGAAQELMNDLVRPFVYRRYLDYGVFESLREMKSLIAAEVRNRNLASNIKLGPGGIREVEFIAQSLQLVRGGANDKLRRQDLAGALREIERSHLLSPAVAKSLYAAYQFMRRLENHIQALRDQQTHNLPDTDFDQARLALAMHCDNWEDVLSQLDLHRSDVTRHFREVAFRADGEGDAPQIENAFEAQWKAVTDSDGWQEFLLEHGFEQASELANELVSFAAQIQPQKLDKLPRKRLAQFIPSLLLSLQPRKAAAETLRRVLRILGKIVRRSAYVALLNENPVVLRRLIDLCEQSAYFAGEIGRFPLLLDEMLDPRLFHASLTADDMCRDLAGRLQQAESSDSERRVEVLGQFQRATLFRIAIAEFSGDLPIMKVSDALTELAELVLQTALDIAWADLTGRHGEPSFELDGRRRRAGFGVVAYGKLGGMELSYGSDLDLVFLHNSEGDAQLTNGDKVLENSMFFARLVRRLVHFLTTQTPSGALYEVDTRLRPSGRSGLLVTSVDAFERYQHENAWTWEHQALLRSRPVAGSVAVSREFERIRRETLQDRVNRDDLAGEVKSMRSRMREQLDKSTREEFDLKQGAGGMADLEFLVQFLALLHARQKPAVIFYPDNIRQLGTLAAGEVLPEADVSRLQQIYRSYRMRLHRLALDGLDPLVSSSEFTEQRQFVSWLWERELN